MRSAVVTKEPENSQGEDQEARDEEVLQLLQSEDPRAAERLVEVFGDRVYGLAVRILNSEEDAKEAVQETFLTIWNKWDTFRGQSKFSSWIYRIAANQAFMKLRKKKRQRHEVSFEQMDEEGAGDPSLQLAGGAASDMSGRGRPDRALEAEEMRGQIRKAVDALPDIYRTAYMLKDVEGMSLKEIAEIMEISEPAAKSRVHRARLELRKLLAPYLER